MVCGRDLRFCVTPVSDCETRDHVPISRRFRGANGLALRHSWLVFNEFAPASAQVRIVDRGQASVSRLVRRPDVKPSPPLVSCLMVTAARPASARIAIECFLRQTYSHRELVIVDDGPADELARHVDSIGDERIRMLRRESANATLGELRNVAVHAARGEVICQWDDDDLFDPDRLWWQVGVLLDAEVDACFLERWTILWTDGPRVAIGTRRLWEGSMVARRDAIAAYPALRRGEDSPVAEALVNGGKVALLDLPELYVYLVHGSNTFDSAHFDAHWEAATLRFEDPNAHLEYLQNRVPIAEALAANRGPR